MLLFLIDIYCKSKSQEDYVGEEFTILNRCLMIVFGVHKLWIFVDGVFQSQATTCMF